MGGEFLVAVNDEEQHSLWPTDRPLPQGWREEGSRGDRDFCLEQIERVWTDMRPKSLRDMHESRREGR